MLFSRHFKITITYILPVLIVMLAGGVFWMQGRTRAAIINCSFTSSGNDFTGTISDNNNGDNDNFDNVTGATYTTAGALTVTYSNATDSTANCVGDTPSADITSFTVTFLNVTQYRLNGSVPSTGNGPQPTLTQLGQGAASGPGGVTRRNPQGEPYVQFFVDQPLIYNRETGQLDIRGANFGGQEKVAVDGVEVPATVLGPRDITASAPGLAAGERTIAVFDVNQRVEVKLIVPEVPDDPLPPHIRLTAKEEVGPQRVEATAAVGPAQFLTAGGGGSGSAELSVGDTRNAEGDAGKMGTVSAFLVIGESVVGAPADNTVCVGFLCTVENEEGREARDELAPALVGYDTQEIFGLTKASPLTISLNVSDYGRLEVRTGGGGLVSSNSVGPGVLPISIPNSENGTFVITLFDSNGAVAWSLKAVVVDGALISLDSGNLPAESKLYPKTAGRPVAFGVDAVDSAGNYSWQILPFKGETAPEAPEEGPFFEIDVEEVAPFFVTLAKIPGIFEVNITDSEAPEAFSGLPFRITMARAPVISVSLEDTDPFLVSLRGPIIKELLDELVIEVLDEEGVVSSEPFDIFIEEEPLGRRLESEEPITIEVVEEGQPVPAAGGPLVVEIVEESPLPTEEEITISIKEVPEPAVAEDPIEIITIREVVEAEPPVSPSASSRRDGSQGGQEEPLSIIVEPPSQEALTPAPAVAGRPAEAGQPEVSRGQSEAAPEVVPEAVSEDEGLVAKLKKPMAVIIQAVQAAVGAVADFLGFGSDKPEASLVAPSGADAVAGKPALTPVASVSATWSAAPSAKAPADRAALFRKIRSIFPSKPAVTVRPAGHRTDISATWNGYEAKNLDTSAWPAMHYGATSAYKQSLK